MATLRYISHPEVVMDPRVPVPEWTLSDLGRRRAETLATRSWVARVRHIVSSTEPKAVETAQILAGPTGLDVELRAATAEIDRSSTGYLPPQEHEAAADALFAHPDRSHRGWERAVDAQRRMVDALADLLETDGDVAVVGHGGVGTLWWCHLSRSAIARTHDQPHGGHVYAVDLTTGQVGAWTPFETA